MQTCSQGWKDNQLNPLVSESFLELTYEIGDPDSLADASATDNGATEFANTAITVNEIDETMVKYATFERNLWKMDGSCKLLPDVAPYSGTGFVGSGLSDSSNLFLSSPLVTVSFNQVFTKLIPGVTIKWGEVYGDYASDFIVTAYNGAAVVATKTVTGNTDIISQVLLDITNYNKITVEITKWANPNRRARIEEIFVGIKRVYGKGEVLDYKHSQSVDLLSFKLPKAQIAFDISNLDGEYNPFNLSGNAKYLIERQRILVKYGYKINNAMEWIKAGGFYLSEWNIPQNGIRASFTARDLLEFMNARYSGTISNITLYDLAISALTQAALPLNRDGSVKWIISASLQLITVSAILDEKTTIAEVLQLVANAGSCVIYQDRNEKLHIEPLSSTLTDYIIDQKNSYANAELELSKKLKSVDVNNGSAIVTNETDGEVQNVKNDLIPSAQAATVGTWVKDTLKNRMILKGDYRADPRLDALDKITVVNKYASSTIIVTDIEYTYNGAFRGKYEGRVMP